MAGSGKTTFIQRLNAHLHEKNLPGYLINLDPAVMHLPYSPNIDIRDTVRRLSASLRGRLHAAGLGHAVAGLGWARTGTGWVGEVGEAPGRALTAL